MELPIFNYNYTNEGKGQKGGERRKMVRELLGRIYGRRTKW